MVKVINIIHLIYLSLLIKNNLLLRQPIKVALIFTSMTRYIVLILILISARELQAQFYLQPEFGQVYNHQAGINNIGSVRTVPNSGNNAVTSVSIMMGYALDKRWGAGMRLRYFTGLYGFLAADLSEDNGVFGPVVKSNTIGAVTINIQPMAQLRLLKIGKFSVSALAGPSMLFQNPVDNSRSDFNGRHPNTETVVNQINDSVKPFMMGIALGGVVTYWRLSLTVDYHNNLNTSFTKDLMLDDKKYLFHNSVRYLGFSLGYKLIGYQKEGS